MARGGGRGGRGGHGRGRGRGRGAGSGPMLANSYINFKGSSPLGAPLADFAVYAAQSTLVVGGADGKVRMVNAVGVLLSEQQEQGVIQAVSMLDSFLFVAYDAQSVGFVKAYDFSATPPTTFELKLDANQFPAAHRVGVRCVLPGVGGNLVATGGADGAVRIWQFSNGLFTHMGALGGHPNELSHEKGAVTKLCVVGKFLASADETGEIRIWNLPGDGTLAFKLQPHGQAVSSMLVYHDKSKKQDVLITGSLDCCIKVFSIRENGFLDVLFSYPPNRPKKPQGVTALDTAKIKSGKRALFVGYANGAMAMYELPEFKSLGFLDGHKRGGPVSAIRAVEDHFLYAVGQMGDLNCFEIVPSKGKSNKNNRRR